MVFTQAYRSPIRGANAARNYRRGLSNARGLLDWYL